MCCVANYRPRKGIEVLVEAIEPLPLHRDPALCRRLGDASRSRIASSFRHEEKLALYQSLARA